MRSGQRLFTSEFIKSQRAKLLDTSRKNGEYKKLLNEKHLTPILEYMARLVITPEGNMIGSKPNDSYEDFIGLIDATITLFDSQVKDERVKQHPLSVTLLEIKSEATKAADFNFYAIELQSVRSSSSIAASEAVVIEVIPSANVDEAVERMFTTQFIAKQRALLQNQSQNGFSESLLNEDALNNIFIYMETLFVRNKNKEEVRGQNSYLGLLKLIDNTMAEFHREHRKYNSSGFHPLKDTLKQMKVNIIAAAKMNAPDSVAAEEEAATLSASCARILKKLGNAVVPSKRKQKVLGYGFKGAMIGFFGVGCPPAALAIVGIFTSEKGSAYTDYVKDHAAEYGCTIYRSYSDQFTCGAASDSGERWKTLDTKASDYGVAKGNAAILEALPVCLPLTVGISFVSGFIVGISYGYDKASGMVQIPQNASLKP